MLIRNYKFRIYPSKKHSILMNKTLYLCRDLYNACLQERIEAYRGQKKSISRFEQSNELPELKKQLPEYESIHSKLCQDVVHRVDISFKNFFRRIKSRAKKPGFPRYKGEDRYDSFTYVHNGWKIDEDRLSLYKIGSMKIVRWKQISSEEKIKQVIVKKEGDQWFAILTVDNFIPNKLKSTGKDIGIDLGLKNLVTTSNGEVLGDIDRLKKQEKWISKLQRRLSQKKLRSNRRDKAKMEVSKAHRKLKRIRVYQLHCISRKLVQDNDLIAVEDLDIAKLNEQKDLKGKLGKNVRRTFKQAALGELTNQLNYKAEEAGRSLIRVDPKGTTQRCSNCNKVVPKDINTRVHKCPYCGLTLDRDHNAARNILKLALWANRRDDLIRDHQSEEFAVEDQELMVAT